MLRRCPNMAIIFKYTHFTNILLKKVNLKLMMNRLPLKWFGFRQLFEMLAATHFKIDFTALENFMLNY